MAISEPKVRIQLEISANKQKELERMMKEADISTRKDLFNNALALLEWAIEEVKQGRTIASIDEANKSYKELVLPALLAVAPKKKDTIFG